MQTAQLFAWQLILDGYDKATLTIVCGKPRDTLSIFDISPTPSAQSCFRQ